MSALVSPASDVGLAIVTPRTATFAVAEAVEAAKERIAVAAGVPAHFLGVRRPSGLGALAAVDPGSGEPVLEAAAAELPTHWFAPDTTACHFPVDEARLCMLRYAHSGTCLPVPTGRVAR